MSNNHYYNRAEAEALARKFDLVAAMPMAFKDHSYAMRKVNPGISLLAYANATLASSGDAKGLPESAYAHNSSGRRITSPAWGTYLMESSNYAWRQAANNQCDSRAARGGYDGCLVDMLTLGIFSKGFVSSLPVNPATRNVYTQAQYRDQMIALGRHYRNQSPGLVHVGNSVENSYRYWQASVSSRPIATSLPSAQMEDFLRGARNSVTAFPMGDAWLRNVKVVTDLHADGSVGLFTTKLWVSASDSQVRAWQKFSMASFLMGANGKSYFAFTRSRDKAGATGANAPYTMPKNIGWPSGGMFRTAAGGYQRTFSNGATIVNPTSQSVTFRLGSTMKTLDGRWVSSITLPPNGADVLIKG